jgi:hypothetical protein
LEEISGDAAGDGDEDAEEIVWYWMNNRATKSNAMKKMANWRRILYTGISVSVNWF